MYEPKFFDPCHLLKDWERMGNEANIVYPNTSKQLLSHKVYLSQIYRYYLINQ